MRTGMLWWDDDHRRTLNQKVWRAANRYNEKYKRWPDTVYANPATVAGECIEGMTLKESANILPNHFWLGMVDE